MDTAEYVLIKGAGGAYVAASEDLDGTGYLTLHADGIETRLAVEKSVLVSLIHASRRAVAQVASAEARARLKEIK